MKEVYYPLSKIDEKYRDIALLELETAHSLSSNQSKIYTHFANVLIGLATLILTVSLNSEKFSLNNYLTENNLFIFTIFLFLVGIIILRYFSDLQKEITINARKVVTLRTMLGLDYSSVQLTLPRERIEGATNPFNIKLFNGWSKFQSAPVFILIILVSLFWTLIFYNININNLNMNKYFFIDSINLTWFIGVILILITYLLVYRLSLYDRH